MSNLWRNRNDRLKKIHIYTMYMYSMCIQYTPNIFGMYICIYMHTCMHDICSVHKNIYDLLEYLIGDSPDCSTKVINQCKAEEPSKCSV